ncbi:MAG: pinensin family lanthipeptide [Cyclobacteriaceae bacterium]
MKKRLKLNELAVSSFVTNHSSIRGGAPKPTKFCPPDPESYNCSGEATTGPCICNTCDLACEFSYDPDVCVAN